MFSKRLFGTTLMGAIVLPLSLQGCSDDGSNPLCCTEFKVGAAIDANIGGSAESKVAVQAVADFAGIASAALDDITTACRSIAQDLDAPKADQEAAEANTDRKAKMDAYCKLAVTAIGTVKGKAAGTLTVKAQAPKCQASVSAKANCQAQCSGGAKCDLKANPPVCKGGSLEVACKGECTAKAGATLKCEGSCSAECKGSCVAKGGVQCSGKCEGKCKGQAEGGTGKGIQADGTCDGTCEGTCAVTAPGVTCEGSCTGECGGSCTGSAEASVKCDGECKADFEPLKCEGGKLEGGCKVEAKCDANCDASVSAKAECTPPSVVVAFSGAADIQAAGRLQATLEANLGVILAFKSRLEGMVAVTASFGANVKAVTDIKAACIPPVVLAVGAALDDVQASVKATASIAGSVGAT
jgi:hypothetical protein